MKIALMFPGQGSQYTGMGKDLYERSDKARYVFDHADEILGFSISEKCFKGPEEDLKKTEFTQPAILAHSIAAFETLNEKISGIHAVAGHSLGEYSALYAGGALSLEQVISLVQKRGEAMSGIKGGGLAALMGRDFSKVSDLCEATGFSISIYNSPKQIILAGRDEDFDKLSEKAGEYGIRRVKRLKVSGPFHSDLMIKAAEEFSEHAAEADVKVPEIPLYMNTSARPENDPESIRKNMISQIHTTVRWKELIENMINDGIDTFIEVGPGKVLSNIVASIDRNVRILNADTYDDISGLEERLQQEVSAC